jgi:flavin reductase (DIM6/NTAB) family NADH-FMN oxidoreductase RutF
MIIDPVHTPHKDFYRLLIGAVGPRPIAWVSTLSATGSPNLAPFSFFNCVCARPPLLAFAPAPRQVEDGLASKDTLRNIRETGEFVINVVTFALTEAMNLTSGEYDASVNEFELAKVRPRASHVIKPPQVAESPISFECKLRQVLDFGEPRPTGHLVIGQIVSVFADDSVMKDGLLDGNALDLLGRMGGIQYSRTTTRFDLKRP